MSRNPLGRKSHLVALLRRGTGVAPNGEARDTFTRYTSQYAAIRHRTAREIDASGRFQIEEDTFDFIFRYSDETASLSAGDRISYDGRVYEPAGNPKDTEGRKRELVVPVRLVKPTTA